MGARPSDDDTTIARRNSLLLVTLMNQFQAAGHGTDTTGGSYPASGDTSVQGDRTRYSRPTNCAVLEEGQLTFKTSLVCACLSVVPTSER